MIHTNEHVKSLQQLDSASASRARSLYEARWQGGGGRPGSGRAKNWITVSGLLKSASIATIVLAMNEDTPKSSCRIA